jgi:hypothetical protein
MNVSNYWKGIIAGLGALVVGVQTVVDDGTVTEGEWGILLTVVLAFVGVVMKKNVDKSAPNA